MFAKAQRYSAMRTKGKGLTDYIWSKGVKMKTATGDVIAGR